MLLSCIGGGKDTMHLEAYLGNNCDAIMSCQVEQLPKIFNPILDKQPDEPATPEKMPASKKLRKTAHQKRREDKVMEDEEDEMFMVRDMGLI